MFPRLFLVDETYALLRQGRFAPPPVSGKRESRRERICVSMFFDNFISHKTHFDSEVV
jgi:hypothetical protein